MKRLIAALIFAFGLAAQARAAVWYCSTTGTGTGTKANPMSLTNARTGTIAAAGDVIFYRAGTFDFSNGGGANPALAFTVSGTLTAPIVHARYPGDAEWSVIWDAGVMSTANNFRNAINWSASHLRFIEIEFCSLSTESRTSSTTGSFPNLGRPNGPGSDGTTVCTNVGFYGCLFHDMCNGVAVTNELMPDVKVVNCVTYNNGWHATDRDHGHGYYMQGGLTGTHYVRGNISSFNYDNGAQFFSGSGWARHYQIIDCGFFNNGRIPGGTSTPYQFLLGQSARASSLCNGIYIDGVMTYMGEFGVTVGNTSNVGYDLGVTGVVLKNSYFYGGTNAGVLQSALGMGLTPDTGVIQECTNTFVCGAVSNLTVIPAGMTSTNTKPTVVKTFVTPWVYRPASGNVVVYNWGGALGNVTVNCTTLGLLVGQTYSVYNASNPKGGTVATGTMDGTGNIAFPLTVAGTTPANPLGNAFAAPSATAPEFGAFVVLPTSGPGGPWSP